MSTYVYVGGVSTIYDYPTLNSLLEKALLKITAQYSDSRIVFVLDGFGTVAEMVEKHARHFRIGIVHCKKKGQEARYEELNKFLEFKKSTCNLVAIWFTRDGDKQDPPLTDKGIPVIRFNKRRKEEQQQWALTSQK